MAAGNVSSLYYPSSFPDQLRFNPNVSPDPINMATRFKLKPTPVILHKLNKPSNSHLSTPLSFETRMELASRLARRQLETSHESPLSKASLNNQCSSSTPHPLVTKAITATIATSVTKSTTNTKETTIGNIRPSNAAIMTSSHKPHNINNTRQRPRSVSFKEPSKTSRRSVVMATGEDSGIEVSESEEMERVNSDVRRLREELALKLRILPLTSSSSCTTTGTCTCLYYLSLKNLHVSSVTRLNLFMTCTTCISVAENTLMLYTMYGCVHISMSMQCNAMQLTICTLCTIICVLI